jgi:hypothetical protein
LVLTQRRANLDRQNKHLKLQTLQRKTPRPTIKQGAEVVAKEEATGIVATAKIPESTAKHPINGVSDNTTQVTTTTATTPEIMEAVETSCAVDKATTTPAAPRANKCD